MLKQEGYALIGAAFEVYNVLGYGLAEEIYQQSLEIELELRNIPFVKQQQLEISYKQNQLSCQYRPDLMVYGSIVAELKAVRQFAAEHEGQLMNYMRISNKRVGYLINFGCCEKLDWKRFIL